MYYYSWTDPPLPGPGSYATHPAHDVFHTILTVITSVNLLLQAYSFYLMLRVARTQLNEYRYFMMLSTTWDVCLTLTLGFAIQPHVHVPMFDCISARGPVAAFGHEGARISMVFLYTFGTNLIGSQVYSMTYRATAVLKDPSIKRRFLSWPVVAGLQLLQLTCTAAISYGVHLTTLRDTNEHYDGRDLASERTRNAAGEWIWIHRDLRQALLRKMKDTEYITDKDTSIMCFNVFDWTSRYIHAGIVVLFVLTEICSSSAAIWVIRKVGRRSSLSLANHRMHVQLTRLLLLQMLCPFICMVGPVLYFMAGIAGMYSGTVVGFYMGLVVIDLFPLVNALLTITFVAPYRRFTVGWIKSALFGDVRTMSGEQASAGASPVLPDEHVRIGSNLLRINENTRVPGARRNTVFGIGSNHIYPLHSGNT